MQLAVPNSPNPLHVVFAFVVFVTQNFGISMTLGLKIQKGIH